MAQVRLENSLKGNFLNKMPKLDPSVLRDCNDVELQLEENQDVRPVISWKVKTDADYRL